MGFVGALAHCKQHINKECIFVKGKFSQYSTCRNNLAHKTVSCTSLACYQFDFLNVSLSKKNKSPKAETPSNPGKQ